MIAMIHGCPARYPYHLVLGLDSCYISLFFIQCLIRYSEHAPSTGLFEILDFHSHDSPFRLIA